MGTSLQTHLYISMLQIECTKVSPGNDILKEKIVNIMIHLYNQFLFQLNIVPRWISQNCALKLTQSACTAFGLQHILGCLDSM